MRKTDTPKIRVSASIDPKLKKDVWDLLENKSEFVEICLREAVNILEWHYLKLEDPTNYYDVPKGEVGELADRFNKTYKNDIANQAKKGLIKKVNGRWQETNSAQNQENW